MLFAAVPGVGRRVCGDATGSHSLLRSLLSSSGLGFALALVLGLAAPASALVISGTATTFAGEPLEVSFEIDDEIDPGNVVITLSVEPKDMLGDLRGFFAHIGDESLIPGLSAFGDDVTVTKFAANALSDVGRGGNVYGGGSPCPCDIAIGIGEPGIGPDDISRTVFTLTHESQNLTADLFLGQLVGIRVTSVGEEGSGRNPSSKLIGTVPIPEPATSMLFALGLAGLASVGRRPEAA